MSKVSVIGAGSWGTALAILLEKNGHEVTLWSHREEEVNWQKAENTNQSFRGYRYRRELKLPVI